MQAKEVLERVKKDKVAFLNLQFTDMMGCLKQITLSAKNLPQILKFGAWFDGSSIEGFARIQESDLYLKPDPNTYNIIPWLNSSDTRTARLICDIYKPDGKPFIGDPRFILKKMIKQAHDLGYEFNTGPEPEFFLLEKSSSGFVPMDNAGYFDVTSDKANIIKREITETLEMFGIEVEASHHEVAPGQYEVDFKHDDALTTADRLLTLRIAIKSISQKHGLKATFMPKPVMGINGSGMHIHQSLFDLKTRKNAFYDSKGKYNLSKLALHYIAGQLHHVKGAMAIICPTVNSYKRLVSGFEAPVYISWARINRSALIRVPHWFEENTNAARMEIRCPDPACNPYLAFAVMLASGLDGVKKKMKIPEPVEEDLYQFDEKTLKAKNIDTLPSSLNEAIYELKKSKLMQDVLGDHLYNMYIAVKKKEWDEFRTQVTPWELDKYIDI